MCGNLIHGQMPYMKFLYVRSDVCRQLLSDSTSQWTPSLLLAILLVGYTPGPANLFALHCSMKNGVRKALVMWLGLLAGFTVSLSLLGALLFVLLDFLLCRLQGAEERLLHLQECAVGLLYSL